MFYCTYYYTVFTILRHKICYFPARELSLEYEVEKETLKENIPIDINKLMDSQFGKPGTPEREKFREEARTYVYEHTKTAECRNSQKKQK